MNTLYPVFLKLHKLNLLIVGGGYVGYEKLFFILKNSPNANITLVAKEISVQIRALRRGKLVNVADTPDLCDFYLGSIVTRGDLKVAISTNGQSPTFAKRFRQVLEEVLPNDTNVLLKNLKIIRDRLTGNFTQKVKELNDITASLVESKV